MSKLTLNSSPNDDQTVIDLQLEHPHSENQVYTYNTARTVNCKYKLIKKRQRHSRHRAVRRGVNELVSPNNSYLKNTILIDNKKSLANSNATLFTVALSVLFVLLWSSGWVGAKFGLGYSGPFTFLTIRYSIVVIVLSIFIAFLSTIRNLKKIPKSDFFGHAIVGLLSHGFYLAGSVGAMSYGVSAGLVAFMSAMQPLFTTVLAVWILHEVAEQANRLQWFGILLGLVAIYLTLANDIRSGGSFVAYLLLLGSVGAISIATLVDRLVNMRRTSLNLAPSHLIQVIWIHSVSALLLFTALGWFMESFETRWGSEYIATIAYMAIVVSIGSYGLMYLLLRRMNAIHVASLIYLTPPATMLLAWPVLGETISFSDMLGLIVGGLAVVMVLSRSSEKVD